MALYLLGTIMAFLSAYVLKWFIKSKEKSYFILEFPVYRGARWKNIFYTMIEKAKVFVFNAGKVIMVISLLLWVLSSYGPKQKMHNVTTQYEKLKQDNPAQANELNKLAKQHYWKTPMPEFLERQ